MSLLLDGARGEFCTLVGPWVGMCRHVGQTVLVGLVVTVALGALGRVSWGPQR